jgi:hypothetical protein
MQTLIYLTIKNINTIITIIRITPPTAIPVITKTFLYQGCNYGSVIVPYIT